MISNRVRQRGVTLVELVISIVVIGVAVAGVLAMYKQAVGRSADPMLQEQAVAIAEAYMEEITLKSFLDPDTGTVCPAHEASRANYDNVCDYKGLSDTGARDQSGGAPIAGLEQYNVQVSVSNVALNGVPSTQALQVDVQVTHSATASVNVRLTGFRTNY